VTCNLTQRFHRTVALGCMTLGLLAAGSPARAADYDRRADPAGTYQDEQPLPWRGGSTKDDGYPVPQPPPAEYQPRRIPQHAPACLSKYGIRSALNRQGWHAFDNVETRGNIAFMTARNDGGRRFEVEFDSCTGDVVTAHPVVVYVDRPPPPVYYAPRPAIGLYYGYGYGHHRRW
jgi:hypothetical protein